jgi:hypothetical protein
VTPTPVVKPRQYLTRVLWMLPKCTCEGHSTITLVDGVPDPASRMPLIEHGIYYSTWTFNLHPGETLQVIGDWYGWPSSYDYYFSRMTMTINCDGMASRVYECSGGVCPIVFCSMLNGESDCRITITVYACPVCRGRFHGTDPELETKLWR